MNFFVHIGPRSDADDAVLDRWNRALGAIAAGDEPYVTAELFDAVMTGDAKGDIEAKNDDGSTALIIAANHDRVGCVQVLVDAKANLGNKDLFGDNALVVAAHTGRAACAQLLIDAKANLEATNYRGSTPLVLAASYGHSGCAQMLVDAKANFEAKDKFGNTALILAVCSCSSMPRLTFLRVMDKAIQP